MYHSITFGDKNTWDDWHLIPTTRPVFVPPSQKVKTLDIVGGDGLIDLSTSLTGYPVFNNREGSFDFAVANGYEPWYTVYSKIMSYLHGKTMKARLEDELEYYYEGRFTVNNWKSDKVFSTISIGYSVNPYKWEDRTSIEDWKWDTFNFNSSVIPQGEFTDIPALHHRWTYHRYSRELLGNAPVCPIFHISTGYGEGIDVSFEDRKRGYSITVHAKEGRNQFQDIVFCGNDVILGFSSNSGIGKVSIEFRKGYL